MDWEGYWGPSEGRYAGSFCTWASHTDAQWPRVAFWASFVPHGLSDSAIGVLWASTRF